MLTYNTSFSRSLLVNIKQENLMKLFYTFTYSAYEMIAVHII